MGRANRLYGEMPFERTGIMGCGLRKAVLRHTRWRTGSERWRERLPSSITGRCLKISRRGHDRTIEQGNG